MTDKQWLEFITRELRTETESGNQKFYRVDPIDLIEFLKEESGG